jgi:hypothetical protein
MRTRHGAPIRLAVSATLVALIVGAAPASAATDASSGLIATSGVSPFASCTADNLAAQVAQGSVNYPNSEVEPWLDVNPKDASNLVGAYQQDRWNDGGSRGIVASVTKDGGATWTQVPIPGVSKCEGGSFDRATDPWLSFGPDGTLWLVSQVFNVFDGKTGMLVSKSTDGGLTWGTPVDVSPAESVAPRYPFDDKVAITADPNDPNLVYVVWDRGLAPTSWGRPRNDNFKFWGSSQPTLLARTTDGGKTWEPARVLYNPGANNFTIFNQIVALPDGTLVDNVFEFDARKNNDGSGSFTPWVTVLRSRDHGVHWSKPIRVARTIDAYLSDVSVAQRVGGYAIAVDRNPTSPGYGNLYSVWTDGGFSDSQFADIAFTMSRDGGLTWTAPARANLTPRGHSAFTPSIAVAADGTVGVGYYDERSYTGSGPIDTDLWVSHCHPTTDCTATANWSEAHVAGPFDQAQAPDAGGLFLGDYAGLAAAGTTFFPYYAIAGDAGDPSDIWFAKVGP